MPLKKGVEVKPASGKLGILLPGLICCALAIQPAIAPRELGQCGVKPLAGPGERQQLGAGIGRVARHRLAQGQRGRHGEARR